MSSSPDNDQTSNIQLLDRFYGIFLAVTIAFLVVGVPFVFFRKAASAVGCVIVIGLLIAAWRMSRKGQPQKSLVLFAGGLWLVLVALIFGGLPPITTATMLAVAVMLSVVVSIRAGVYYGGSYMLAWLVYVVLGALDMAPAPYFLGKPVVSWFIGGLAIWLVLLPIPTLIRNMRMALSLQRATLEAASDGILVIDNHRRVVTYNGQFARLWRIPAEVLAAGDDKVLMAYVSDQMEDPQQFLQKVIDLYEHPDVSSADTLQFRDGRVFERYSQPQRTDGQVSGRVWSFRDVTERRQAAAKLAESQQRMELALAGADLGLLDWDIRSGGFVQNSRLLEMLGYAEGELHLDARTFESLIHPDDRASVRKAIQAHFKGETPSYEAEHRTRHKNDRWVWILARGKALERDEHGRALRMVGTVLDITERKNSEAALKAREARLANLIGSLQELVFVVNTEGKITEYHLPESFQFPVSAEAALGRNFSEALPDPLAGFVGEAMVGIFADAQVRTRDFALAMGDRECYFQITMSQLSGSGKYASGFLALIRDVSERKRADQEQRIAAIAFEAQEGILITDPHNVILRVNKAFSQITGYSAEEAVGQKTRLLSSGRHDSDFYAAMWDAIKQTGAWQGEVWNRRKNGDIYPEWLTITAVMGDDGTVTHYVGTQMDITERKAAEAEVEKLAYYDSLTQLANRRLLLDRIQHAMAFSARNGREGALLFLDLDKFKTLNDTLGHDMGDLLLQQVAQRLVASVREGDTVARLGGDEFVVMIEGLSENHPEAVAQAEVAGRKILAALNEPYMLADHRHQSTPSIGATLFMGHQHTVDELLKQADTAMYQAKAAGRNTLRFFDRATGR